MGYSISYRSTRPITQDEADAVQRAADALSIGRTWLRCEPVLFHPIDDDGHLLGGSKPNFQPDPGDASSAADSGRPDGTCRDLLDVLCQLSRSHDIDWQVGDDYDANIGAIRAGECDPSLVIMIETLTDVGDLLGEFDPEADD